MVLASKCNFWIDYWNFVEGINYKSDLQRFRRNSKMADKVEITIGWLLNIRRLALNIKLNNPYLLNLRIYTFEKTA